MKGKVKLGKYHNLAPKNDFGNYPIRLTVYYKVNIGNDNMLRVKTEASVSAKGHSWRRIFFYCTVLRFFKHIK